MQQQQQPEYASSVTRTRAMWMRRARSSRDRLALRLDAEAVRLFRIRAAQQRRI